MGRGACNRCDCGGLKGALVSDQTIADATHVLGPRRWDDGWCRCGHPAEDHASIPVRDAAAKATTNVFSCLIIGVVILIILAVLLFVLLYFTGNITFGGSGHS